MDTRTALPVVGMVGGGQLARMTHQAAIALGQSLRVLATSPDDGAALVASDVYLGSPTDLAALRRFAEGCDVVTFNQDHVPSEHVRALAAAGVTVYPSADALRYTQDKAAMRKRLAALGAPAASLNGQVRPRRELAVQLARSPFGQVAVYPVVETVRSAGVRVEVLAPAPDLPEDQAAEIQQLAITIASELDVVGLLAVELFETETGVFVHELAMRPHNSGHWTIEGARTSQFEEHLRAVLDYPMGECGMTAPAVAMAKVLGGARPVRGQPFDERLHHLFAADPGVKVHLYGKEARPARIVGHVTVLGDDLAQVRARAVRAASLLEQGAG